MTNAVEVVGRVPLVGEDMVDDPWVQAGRSNIYVQRASLTDTDPNEPGYRRLMASAALLCPDIHLQTEVIDFGWFSDTDTPPAHIIMATLNPFPRPGVVPMPLGVAVRRITQNIDGDRVVQIPEIELHPLARQQDARFRRTCLALLGCAVTDLRPGFDQHNVALNVHDIGRLGLQTIIKDLGLTSGRSHGRFSAKVWRVRERATKGGKLIPEDEKTLDLQGSSE